MPELYSHEEIATEAGLLAVLKRFPEPLPPEYRKAWRRLRVFAARRGWAFPYRRFVDEGRRATTAIGGHTAAPQDVLGSLTRKAIDGVVTVGPPASAPASAFPSGPPQNAAHESWWDARCIRHLVFDAEYEYYQDETNDVRRGWRGSPIIDGEYRRPEEWIGRWDTFEPRLAELRAGGIPQPARAVVILPDDTPE